MKALLLVLICAVSTSAFAAWCGPEASQAAEAIAKINSLKAERDFKSNATPIKSDNSSENFDVSVVSTDQETGMVLTRVFTVKMAQAFFSKCFVLELKSK